MTTSADRFGDEFGGERMWGLKELPYPDSVSLLPQTPGWIIVAIVVLLVALWLVWRIRRYRSRNAYRREAMQRLAAISKGAASPAELPFLLRKAALMAFPRTDVAGLRGSARCEWLNRVAGRELFTSADTELLDQLAYLPADRLADLQQSDSLQRLVAQTRLWMQVHHA